MFPCLHSTQQKKGFTISPPKLWVVEMKKGLLRAKCLINQTTKNNNK